MELRRLGGSDLHVSALSLGTMTFGEQNSESEAHAQLDLAVSRGVNFIDAAEMYPIPPRAETQGRTESYIGSWLKHQRRDSLIVATKIAGPSRGFAWIRNTPRVNREHLNAAIGTSLKRLQTDYVDLYQIHWPDRYVPMFGATSYEVTQEHDSTPIAEQLQALADLVKAGNIRHIGLSNETPWGVSEFVRCAEQLGLPKIVTVQNAYHLMNRTFEYGLAEACRHTQVSLLAYSPLAFGHLTGKYLADPNAKGRITLFPGFGQRYAKPNVPVASKEYAHIAREAGLSPATMALAFARARWFTGSVMLRASSVSEQQRAGRSSVEIKTLAGFISAIVLLTMMGGYTYHEGAEYLNAARWVEHTQEVRAGLGKLYGTIANIGSSQRGYLLTGKQDFKTELQRYLADLDDDKQNLAQLVTDNPAQLNNLAELKALLARRMDELNKHLVIFEYRGLAAARTEISREDEINQMRDIRSLIAHMDNTELQLLSVRQATLKQEHRFILVALLATLLFAAAILTTLFLAIRREIMARALARDQLSASEENLSVTLDSIGDAVMTTDAHGRVTRLNPVAEQLTGWAQAEADGRPVDDVFRIINQQTRQSATIPVAATLAQGAIQGLANDTMLIARDGSERSIADSCAPIRNREVSIIGAVLVFRDVSKEYAAQTALRNSEERYRTLFESMDEGFCVLEMIYDSDGKAVDLRFVEINPAFETQTGLQQALGKTVREMVPYLEERWFELYGKIARTGETLRFEETAAAMHRHYDVFAFRIGADGSHRVGVLFKDITEIKQSEQALVAAKKQAELANRAKDSFLATMSHEIRTPLTGMLGMLEVLSLTPLNQDQNETLQAAWESARNLLRIVNDVLDWSKIEAGKLHLTPQTTAIPQLLQEVINTYSQVASAKSLVLRQHIDARISPAHVVDALRLSQVLNNFVSNAIKFTHSGEISLSARLLEKIDSGERISFSVKDTGIGIARDAQQHLFRRFQQESVNTARMFGGTGLGLAICKSLVDLMDGQIELVSEPGEGSTFSITLTLPVSGSPGEILQTQNLTVEQRAVRPLFDGGAGSPLVLAVDDHPINRDLLVRQIRLLGLRAETAENGAEALLMWREQRFALIISDCHMPEMDGYALSRAIRKIEAEKGLPRTTIIAWTANALPRENEQCFASGMDDLLVKPANLAQLKKTLAKWLSISETGDSESAHPLRDVDDGLNAEPIAFDQLKQVVPDSAEQIQVLLDFQSSIRTDRARLTEMLAQGDPINMAHTAHRMKGSSRMVGAIYIAKACAAIEQAAQDGDLAGAAKARTELEDAVGRFEAFLAQAKNLKARK